MAPTAPPTVLTSLGLPMRTTDDGQLNLPTGGHAELPGGGQRDYFA
jgi:hypothetical protein